MAARPQPNPRAPRSGFTILEVLVSFAVLAILLVLLATMIGRTSSVWSYTRGQVEQFREARDAFDTLTRKLSEATLNTYLDYEDASGATRTAATSGSFVPRTYGRQSELRFLSGPDLRGESHAVFFQAPLGRTENGPAAGSPRLLNTLGYYVDYGDDAAFLPAFLAPRTRFRLMEFCEPTEKLSVYQFTSGSASPSDRTSRKWFTDSLNAADPPVQIVADNIIALVLLPILPAADRQAGGYSESSLAPDYVYDSTARKSDPNLNPRHQLPALIRLTMVAMDETSARRLGADTLTAIRSAVSTRFLQADRYESDLKSLQEELTRLGVRYEVFTSQVMLKNAKWSREQKG